jgi:hypothetical protein
MEARVYTYIEKRRAEVFELTRRQLLTNNKLHELTDMLVGNTTLCKTQQDRPYTYNGTLRHVRIAISVTYCEGIHLNLVI